ncbi:CFC_HP_G0102280.mRNA.1.CDS.1 [Saccharomyces cerevisiae]|nr:CFC_HP_G0102280.mRNA.1.CDS.1 [Saccharomyces cerevisiae]CAI6903874.1 CFC_HP_G0102280.mRNA.1.CDS.1 [Saccharomyces cerevisiae]
MSGYFHIYLRMPISQNIQADQGFIDDATGTAAIMAVVEQGLILPYNSVELSLKEWLHPKEFTYSRARTWTYCRDGDGVSQY